MSRGSSLLFAVIVCLAGAAGVVLISGNQQSAPRMSRATQFQQLVGGLGFGPARDLHRCAFAFDPRLSPACSEECGAIPGGASFCPYHAGSILDYPPLKGERESRSDAHLP